MAISFCITHPGLLRLNNEDSYFCDDKHSIWIVCDGIGGHQEGNFASRLVTDIFEQLELRGTFEEKIELIKVQIYNIHSLLRKKVRQLENGSIVGTTIVILLSDGKKGACIHAGDSRCYIVRNKQLSLITTDHAKIINTISGYKRVLTNALSAPSDYKLDFKKFKIESNDLFLLCTDGFYEPLTNEEIFEGIINPAHDQALEHLVKKILSKGANDNLTAVVVSMGEIQ